MTKENTLNDFVECDTCRATPGTPKLCEGCLANRALIAKLKSAPKDPNDLPALPLAEAAIIAWATKVATGYAEELDAADAREEMRELLRAFGASCKGMSQ